MSNQDHPPCAMRSPLSVLSQVKNTLVDLVGGAIKKLSDENTKSNGNEPTTPDTNSGHNRTKADYKHRVLTFTLSKWCGKPLMLSPPFLAQYGWECIGEDLVKCCTCAAIVSIRLPWANATNYHEQCRNASQKVLKGHMKICSWPSNACPDSYINPFQMKHLNKEKMIKEFSTRKQRLMLLGKKLPIIADKTLAEMELSDETINKLIQMDGKTSDSEDPSQIRLHTSCVLLALCGWTTICDENTLNPSISCDDTGRKVGLWNFYSLCDDITNQDEHDNDDEIPAKKTKADVSTVIKKSFFHPTQQHNVWSPWIACLDFSQLKSSDDASLVINKDDPPGWKVLLKILLNPDSSEDNDLNESQNNKEQSMSSPSKRTTKTPPRAALKEARLLLQEWSSPAGKSG